MHSVEADPDAEVHGQRFREAEHHLSREVEQLRELGCEAQDALRWWTASIGREGLHGDRIAVLVTSVVTYEVALRNLDETQVRQGGTRKKCEVCSW